MTAETESLILEILMRIQSDIADIKQELIDLKMRVNILEGHVQGLMAAQHLTNDRLDRMDIRIGRIETRLELVEVK
ncbi:MAG: hypothetical protein WDN24_03505 [Sphingomonas sp.]